MGIIDIPITSRPGGNVPRIIQRLRIVGAMLALLLAGLLVTPGSAQALQVVSAAAQTGCTLTGPGFNVEAENYPLPPTLSGLHYYQCTTGNNIPLDIVIEQGDETRGSTVEWTVVATGRGYVCIACRGTTSRLWRINGGSAWRIACNY
jgi:hypothetical protein